MLIDYQINPSLMGGTVNEIKDGGILHINLRGRLGVLEVPRKLVTDEVEIELGHKLEFYFSYLQVIEDVEKYDGIILNPAYGVEPTLVGARFTQVNDTAIEAEILGGLGTVAVPRRFVFTDKPLEVSMGCEFYLSCMKVVDKTELPKPSNQ